MRMPYLHDDGARQQMVVQEFGGYDHRDPISAKLFYDTKNMSSRRYPTASTRAPRGTAEYPALTAPHGLIWAEGLIWADGTGLFREGEKVCDLTDSDKLMVRMGGWLYIWPDKVRYHLTDGTVEQLEQSWTGTAKLTDKTIEASGIGEGFAAYDGITIEGAKTAANNKTAVCLAVEADKLTFSENCFTAETSVTVTVSRKVPDFDYLTELDNRLWGVTRDGYEIRACKLGDPRNWNCYEGLSTDSYAATVGSAGCFTGAATLQGYALVMKEGVIHKMYGTKPSNYQAVSQKVRGPMDGAGRSLAELDEVLYYLSPEGVTAYVGGTPERIGLQLGEVRYTEGVGAAADGRYWLSAKRQDGGWEMLCYDTVRSLWYKEDDTQALYMTAGGGKVWYIDGEDNRIRCTEGEDDETIAWMIETGDLTEGMPEHKHLVRAVVDLRLEAGTTCMISARYDGGEWEAVWVTNARGYRRSVPVPIIPRRCERFALRIEGRGEMVLWAVERTVEAGTELG